MRTKQIAQSDALYLLNQWHSGEDEDISEYEEIHGSGALLVERTIDEAVARVETIRASFQGSIQNAQNAAKFDAEACVAFHSSLPLDAATAGNFGFWRWLALAKFYGIIEWRHPAKDGTHPRNYGVGNRMGNYPARLWFRAEVAFDAHSPDNYRLARRGAIDFWESGVIRPRYSSCRSLVRAFVRYQYPDSSPESPTLHPTDEEGVRKLYKKLQRLQATMALELLDDKQAFELLTSLSSGLRRR